MPTQAVSAETMQVGKKGGGKHHTKAEVDARRNEADRLKRKQQVNLIAPEWLSSGALFVWKRAVDNVAGLGEGDLLDDLDTDMLANYCDAVDKAQTLSKSISKGEKLDIDDDMKLLQGWYRIIATYADKLGFTPQARARLVRKRAVSPENDPLKEFD